MSAAGKSVARGGALGHRRSAQLPTCLRSCAMISVLETPRLSAAKLRTSLCCSTGVASCRMSSAVTAGRPDNAAWAWAAAASCCPARGPAPHRKSSRTAGGQRSSSGLVARNRSTMRSTTDGGNGHALDERLMAHEFGRRDGGRKALSSRPRPSLQSVALRLRRGSRRRSRA